MWDEDCVRLLSFVDCKHFFPSSGQFVQEIQMGDAGLVKAIDVEESLGLLALRCCERGGGVGECEFYGIPIFAFCVGE